MRSLTALIAAGSIAGLVFAAGCVSDAQNSTHTAVEKPAIEANHTDSSDFETAADRKPTARTLYTMARILEAQGKDAQSEFMLRRIITEHPGFVPAYCDLAEALLRQRRTEEAEHTLHNALAVSPHDAVLTNDLGMCMLLRGDYEDALLRFTRAAAARPDDARFRGNMAVALGMMGRYSEALALYQLVLPQDQAHFNLGVLCDARHDSDRAMIEYHQAQALKAGGQSSAQDAQTTKVSGLPSKEPEMRDASTTQPTG